MRTSALAQLPVFPLGGVVLLPEQLLPLHIFESRYRAMLVHVLTGDKLIAMGTPSSPGAVHPVAGVGRVVADHKHEDGRSDIVLQYAGTVDLGEELESDLPFRVFQAVQRAEQTEGQLGQLRSLVLQLVSPDADPKGIQKLLEGPDITLMHKVANQLLQAPADRLVYLDSSTADRAAMVEQRLLTVLANRSPAGEA